MIEENQDPYDQPDAVSQLYQGKSIRFFSGKKQINPGKHLCHRHIIVKCHDGKCCSDKCDSRNYNHFNSLPDSISFLLPFIGNDQVTFSFVLNL